MITLDQKQVETIRSRLSNLRCVACNSQQFSIAEVVVMPMLEKAIPSGLGVNFQQFVAFIPVSCSSCGNTLMLLAKKYLPELF